MKTIVIASQNPVKIRATMHAFQRMFPEEMFQAQKVNAASDVSEQPRSDEETLNGAANRASHAAQKIPQANFWVGIEGGVAEHGDEMSAFAWVVILGQGQLGKARTGTFFLPTEVTKLVRQGLELGQADDIVFQRENSKQDNGAVGLLTGNVLDRSRLYEQAILLALIPFCNPALYPPQTVLE